ncbi:hypothetical protein FK531_20335 [Rhodococcus spelaei]|uniref:ESX-1 secretion-associated protein n=1 Tax=Rhodococcus spelaei TaxID=2546320 RepID=A0A541B0E6_9NOCA|nr:type VII secretion target [Rhodococcus spelaei]TQF65780.1 hypothetical protein FK531_20335 [Rhodococcus spelaei]
MKVDTAALRAFASAVDDAGTAIDAIQAIDTGTALPGSTTGPACAQATTFVEGAYLRVADRMRRMGTIARGNANEFDVTESEFTDRLGSMGAQV